MCSWWSFLSSLSSADGLAGAAIFAPDWANAEFGEVGATPADAEKEITVNKAGRMNAISVFIGGVRLFWVREKLPDRSADPKTAGKNKDFSGERQTLRDADGAHKKNKAGMDPALSLTAG